MAGVNNMELVDVYQLLNNVHNQVTGRNAIAPTDLTSFVSQATTTLLAGTDTVYNALMQSIGKVVFSSRAYGQKFGGLRKDDVVWGGITRKVTMADSEAEEELAYHPTDGQAVDQWTIKKGEVLETRFYGSTVYQDWYTVFETQLKNAFSSPNELGSFVATKTTEMNNKWTQYQEELSRMLLCNLIGAKDANKVTYPDHIVHLLSEYNTLTGLSLTAQDVYKPDNIAPFFRFVRSRINTISRRLTERSEKYQFKIRNLRVNRHTPLDRQKIYLSADALDIIDTMVNTQTYHDEPLRYADVQAVSYWQAIDNPMSVSVKPNYIDSDGKVVNADKNVVVNNVFGVIFDDEALLYNVKDYKLTNTGLNARGLYFNSFLTSNIQYASDLTEKSVLLMLD